MTLVTKAYSINRYSCPDGLRDRRDVSSLGGVEEREQLFSIDRGRMVISPASQPTAKKQQEMPKSGKVAKKGTHLGSVAGARRGGRAGAEGGKGTTVHATTG